MWSNIALHVDDEVMITPITLEDRYENLVEWHEKNPVLDQKEEPQCPNY